MNSNLNPKIGSVEVADEVFLTIAGLAATEVKGVYALGRKLTHDMVPVAGIKTLSKCIKIVSEKDESAISIKVALTVDGSVALPKISEDVSSRVKSAIEAMTGMKVVKTDIQIVGVAE